MEQFPDYSYPASVVKSQNQDLIKVFLREYPASVPEVFLEACRGGYLETATWMAEKYQLCMLTNVITWPFRASCENGHLHIAKWFVQTFPDYNVHEWEEDAFRWTCFAGQLEVVEWLLEKYPNINIRALNDMAFSWACQRGHLELAKLLLKKCPESAITTDIYKAVLEQGHVSMCRWLVEQKPELLE